MIAENCSDVPGCEYRGSPREQITLPIKVVLVRLEDVPDYLRSGHLLLALLQKEAGEDYTQTEFGKLVELDTTGTFDILLLSYVCRGAQAGKAAKFE